MSETYYSKHKEELKAKAREYYRKNRLRIKAKAKARYKMGHGDASRKRQEKYHSDAEFASDVREYNRTRQRTLRAKKTAKNTMLCSQTE